MRHWLGFLLVIASGAALAQPVLDLQDTTNDLAFKREAVEAFAGRAYRARLTDLASHADLDRDPALLARLRTLMTRIAEAAAVEDPASGPIAWELHTCRSCGESAAAMAGGKILVGEEFLAAHHLSDDEAGFVLAHEAAHVLAQHTRELATVARYFVDNGLHREYWDIQRELDASFGAQLHLAFVSARQEEEADRIGFVLGARAGLEPAAMMTLLAKLDASDAPGFGSHPGGKRRLELAAAVLPAARIIQQQREGSGAGP
jgi:Zn-dependent protease with chaperone function